LSRCRACRSIQTIARHDPQRIHVTVPGSNADPRSGTSLPPHVQIHRTPPLHPDDVVTLPSGLRVTSVARTLIDLAEVLTADELREAFIAARARGLLDVEEVRRSRARVEWRPSLAMLDAVIAEFEDACDRLLRCSIMATDVPQRELRNNTAAVLRRVEAGERVRITVHGHPVAELVPAGGAQQFAAFDRVVAGLRGLMGADDRLDAQLRDAAAEPRDPFA